MLVRLMRLGACCLMVNLGIPASAFAQAPPSYIPPPDADAQASGFSVEQLDALLAPVALYPDPLLTQVLMATTYPLQVVDAARWVEEPGHKELSGDALVRALEPMDWDPSVKSLVPFPQVLAMMNAHLEWLQQIGYAFAQQQDEVMESVQRLRAQAQAAGNLQSTPQQVVSTQMVAAPADVGGPPQQVIVIQPAAPNVVYVPVYNPVMVYGAWPYAAYPPVYFPPPPAYYATGAVVGLLSFGVAVMVTSALWGWASPRWGYGGYGGYRGYGGVNVNVNRYNSINVNRTQIHTNVWQANRPGGGRPGAAPPGGPVGRPSRPGGGGLPANAVGRPSVQVPGSAVNRPAIGVGQRPSLPNGAANRPNPPNGGGNRPGLPNGGANRPGGGGAAARPEVQRPAVQRPAPQRPAPAAISGMNNGRQAPAMAARGAQSRGGGAAQQRPQAAARGAAAPQRPQGGGGARPAGGGRAGGDSRVRH